MKGEIYMVHPALKKVIIDWLFDHPNVWNRKNVCTDTFRAYVYDSAGNYLIGGKDVYEFIGAAEELIYGESR